MIKQSLAVLLGGVLMVSMTPTAGFASEAQKSVEAKKGTAAPTSTWSRKVKKAKRQPAKKVKKASEPAAQATTTTPAKKPKP